MTEKLHDALLDKSCDLEQRIAAAEALLDGFSMSNYELYGKYATIFMDEEDDFRIRLVAIKALEMTRNVNVLVRLVKDPQVRAAAISALDRIGPSRNPSLATTLETIQKHLSSKTFDPQVSMAIANLPLSHGRDPQVIEILKLCSRSEIPEIRAGAVSSLATLGEYNEVLSSLSDPAAVVRLAGASFCGYSAPSILGEPILSKLKHLLGDPDESVSRIAQASLKKLGLLEKPEVKRQQLPQASKAATTYDWQALMQGWSLLTLEDADYLAELPNEVVESGWLGYPPASAGDIEDLERRIGKTLPRSYREFLELSNGWRRLNFAIDDLLSTSEVDYFRANNQQWIDAYAPHDVQDVSDKEHRVYDDAQDSCIFRHAYLQSAIQISAIGDGVFLLNPEVATADGEWEAWFFANWLPGAVRYPSFWEMLSATYEEECAEK